jgi:hypothetical protein
LVTLFCKSQPGHTCPLRTDERIKYQLPMSVRHLQNILPALYLVCGGHFIFCELDAGEERSEKDGGLT